MGSSKIRSYKKKIRMTKNFPSATYDLLLESPHKDLLLILWIGTKQKWWASAVDSPLHAAAQPIMGEDSAEPGPSVPVAGAATAAAPPTVAKQEKQKKRAKTPGMLQYCLEVLLNDVSCRLWHAMGTALRPVETRMRDMQTSCKTLRGSLHEHLQLCCLGFDRTLGELLGGFATPARTEELFGAPGSMSLSAGPRLLQEDAIVFQRVWTLIVHASGELACTGVTYQVPPLLFVGLLSPNKDQVQNTLTQLQTQWRAYEALEGTALDNQDHAHFLRQCLIPLQQWCMEIYLRLWQCDFLSVPTIVTEEIGAFAATFLGTEIVENAFRVGRTVASLNQGGKLQPESLWHAISLSQSPLQEYERPPIRPTSVARGVASKRVPSSIFHPEPSACTLDREVLSRLQSDSPHWPTVNGTSWKRSSMHWKLLAHVEGDAQRALSAWVSMLCQPGFVLTKTGSNVLHICLFSCSSGFLGWPMSIDKGEGTQNNLQPIPNRCHPEMPEKNLRAAVAQE